MDGWMDGCLLVTRLHCLPLVFYRTETISNSSETAEEEVMAVVDGGVGGDDDDINAIYQPTAEPIKLNKSRQSNKSAILRYTRRPMRPHNTLWCLGGRGSTRSHINIIYESY